MLKRLFVLVLLALATLSVSTPTHAATGTHAPTSTDTTCPSAQVDIGHIHTDGVDALYFIEYYYYSDATYTVQVGYRYWDQCMGTRYSEGIQTSYYIRESYKCSCPYC